MILGETYILDEIDRQLVAELQADAKISLKEVGVRVGLSAPSVLERVRKLEAAGVITGYHAVVDARKLGLDVAAFIGVSIGNPENLEKFEDWAAGVPQVLECHHVTGGHTLLVKVKTANTQSLERLISRIRSFDGVSGTETMIVLSTKTERVQVSLESATRPNDAPRKRRRRKVS